MCLQSLMKFHHCMFKMLRKTQKIVDKELRRAITLTELAFSITNVHLVVINVFAKFYEIPSLLFQDIEKPKRCGRTNGWMDNVKTVYPHPPPTQQTQFAGVYNNIILSVI